MLIDLTGLTINKLEKKYVNVNSREREKEREIERKNSFLSKRASEKKMWQKDGRRKIVRNIKSRSL